MSRRQYRDSKVIPEASDEEEPITRQNPIFVQHSGTGSPLSHQDTSSPPDNSPLNYSVPPQTMTEEAYGKGAGKGQATQFASTSTDFTTNSPHTSETYVSQQPPMIPSNSGSGYPATSGTQPVPSTTPGYVLRQPLGQAGMPIRGTKGAPRTFKGKYSAVERFFDHLERLFQQHGVT